MQRCGGPGEKASSFLFLLSSLGHSPLSKSQPSPQSPENGEVLKEVTVNFLTRGAGGLPAIQKPPLDSKVDYNLQPQEAP